MTSPDLDRLVDDHWNYIHNLLTVHGTGTRDLEVIGFHYKSAFLHGYKHATEDCRE